jgi:hypothetical protein
MTVPTPQYPFTPAGTDPFNPTKILGNLTLDDAPGLVLTKEFELFKADPIGIIRAGYLKIKDKAGNLVPFVPNAVQMQVIKAIQAKRAKRLPVRIAILKGRQFGVSTLSEAITFVFSTMRAYTTGMIVADDQDGAERLFEMTKLFHEHMRTEQPHLTPKLARSSDSEIEFYNKRSNIYVETAGKRKKVGRKYTLRVVHCSEVAFWPEFGQAHKSLSQAVPNLPETIMIYETTANGVEDFCKFWRRIKKLSAAGQSDWIPLFLSWKDHAEYSRPFATEKEKQAFGETISKDEQFIQQTHGLSLEQLNWRRWKIDNDFGGDASEFAVEFPLDDNEAFRSTGKAVFSEQMLRPQEQFIELPKMSGEVDFIDRRAVFQSFKNGDLSVWEGPKAGHRYLIASDSSESAASSDYACAVVLDLTVKRQVAELHGRIPADLFGQKLFALGAWYNWAHIVPECNGPGVSTVGKLVELSYPNLYRRKRMVFTDYGEMEEVEEFGWRTTVKTKPFLVDAGRDVFRRMAFTLKSVDLLDELRTFVVKSINEEGYVKYAAEEGFYDDRAMAFLIALYVAREIPEAVSSASTQIDRRNLGLTGYGGR